MSGIDNNALALNRAGTRFLSPATEKAYRDQSIVESLPIARLSGYFSLPIWVFFPIAINNFSGLAAEKLLWIFILSYGVVTPMMVIALLISYTRHVIQWGVTSVCLVLCVTAGTHGIFCMLFYESVGAGQLNAVFFALFALVLRLPLMASLIGITPALAIAYYMNWTTALSIHETITYYVFITMTLVLIVLLSVLMDVWNRKSFISNETVKHQQVALETSRNQIRRYIPPAVADQIISGNEAAISDPKRQRVTVLFSDIVGFTDIADRVEPEVMTEVLGSYMSAMADLIEQHGGTLNEFAGDGLMALFGAPNTMAPEDQARNAIQAAQSMQAKMPELNEQWRKLGLGAELKTRIGINTGMVSVGSYGSQGRMTYTAIGLQTNIASRIESAAEPGQILISDATYQLIHGDFDCEPRGEVECKGVHFPVKIYATGTVS